MELGIGALLGVGAPVFSKIPAALRPALAWSGAGGMVFSLFSISAATPFPAPTAALPVLSAALFIIAGTGTEKHRFLIPFTNRVSSYLGDISYSLYLWHFPVIIFAGIFVDLHQPMMAMFALLLILMIAVYSFHLLEDPIRRSQWLDAKRARRQELQVSDAYKLTALSLGAVLTAAVTVAALMGPAAPAPPKLPSAVAPSNAPASQPAGLSYGPQVTRIQSQIKEALSASSWPDLTPTMDEVIAGPQVPPEVSRCGGIAPTSEPSCTWGDPGAAKTAVIIGDSVALTYVTALKEVFKGRPDWKLVSYAAFGCSFTETRISNADPKIVEGCPAKKDEAVAAIGRLHPDLVFITNTYEPRPELVTKNPLTPAQWQQSTQAFVQSFAASAKKVVFLAPPPSQIDVKKCYNRVSASADCVSQVNGQWYSIGAAEQQIAKNIGATWFDSSRLFCDSRGLCPSFVGTTPTKMDNVHMTADYARKISSALAEEFVTQRILIP